jgi:hypothetical protein
LNECPTTPEKKFQANRPPTSTVAGQLTAGGQALHRQFDRRPNGLNKDRTGAPRAFTGDVDHRPSMVPLAGEAQSERARLEKIRPVNKPKFRP